MGEAKARAKAGKRNADKMITVGMVATRWDEVPDVGVATLLFEAPASEFTQWGKFAKKHGLSQGDLVRALQEGFAMNIHAYDSQKFAIVAMAYIGNTKTFATAHVHGADGLWVRHLSRGVDCVARSTVVTTADKINEWMDDLRADRLDPEMETVLVYSDREDDATFTGGLTRKGDKLYTLGGTELRRKPTGSTANSAARSIWDRISKTMH